jgi:glycosyltransferase involved in cell wall biosynthesis
MRILTVSAHYPPNFMSGGTLQPQRLARGLAERGHEVSVYAGWLGDRAPLETWTEHDETGLAIRWIVTTPWTGWADERNWLNPAVTDDFRAHVETIRPDIVHFHSLQSLGAGLLPAAKTVGAKVVVTMHDFWWLCSRQFLVDRDSRPCSVVVDAGVCPCEVDESRRQHRGRSLAGLLRSADLVLAASASAARVLAANGVAPDRLEVDENGLPPAPEIAEALPAAEAVDAPSMAGPGEDTPGPLRLLYAGGPDAMKGADVLVDAVTELGERVGPAGWRMSAYGLGPRLDRIGLVGLPIDAPDPYDPAERPDVLAAHDVLVLASVALETHSLLTREALHAGLPVVCTDNLGPEEVVVDGDNGLIVPVGDASALAATLARLVTDRRLVDRLRAGAHQPVATRTLDDQVSALEDRFAELLGEAAPDPAPAMPTVRSVVFACGIDGAPLRYRAWLPAEALERVGVTSQVLHYRHPELLAAATQADVVVLYRVPATVQVLALVEALHGASIPVVFDVDDLIFDPDEADEIPALRTLPPAEAALWLEGVRRYRTTLEAADAFIGSTDLLVEAAAALTGLPAHRFDNGVGLELARAADRERRRPRRPGPLRLGYFSGTTTHDEDWFHIEPAVIRVLDLHPDVELWLGGYLPTTPGLSRFGDRVRRLPFRPWLELPGILRDLDVNLAPLAPARFNEAKSAIKWLEAALVATPTVASATGPFAAAITDGVDGRLVEETAGQDPTDQWEAVLSELLADDAGRARIGARARRRALLEWSPDRQGRRYLDLLTAVVAAGPVEGRASGWTPVAPDEPPEAIALEPYGTRSPSGAVAAGTSSRRPWHPPDDLAASWATARARIEDLARRGWASVHTIGVRATGVKVADRLDQRWRARAGR